LFLFNFLVVFFFVIAFNADVKRNESAYTAGATEWVTCVLTNPAGEAACGAHPAERINGAWWIGLHAVIAGQGLWAFLVHGTQAQNYALWARLLRGGGVGGKNENSDQSSGAAKRGSGGAGGAGGAAGGRHSARDKADGSASGEHGTAAQKKSRAHTASAANAANGTHAAAKRQQPSVTGTRSSLPALSASAAAGAPGAATQRPAKTSLDSAVQLTQMSALQTPRESQNVGAPLLAAAAGGDGAHPTASAPVSVTRSQNDSEESVTDRPGGLERPPSAGLAERSESGDILTPLDATPKKATPAAAAAAIPSTINEYDRRRSATPRASLPAIPSLSNSASSNGQRTSELHPIPSSVVPGAAGSDIEETPMS
jgi:hypothetical protein